MHDLLETEDVAAVLSHELGHVRKGHLGLHAIAAGSFLLSLAPIDRATASLPAWISGSILLAYGAAYWILFFGAVSRWLEIEADFAGAEAVGLESYTAALAKVGAYLGPVARRDGWRHFSLEKRLGLLEGSHGDPAARAAITRRFRSFRGALLLLAALSVGGFVATVAMDLDRPHEEIAIESARIALGQAEDLRALVADSDAGHGWISRHPGHARPEQGRHRPSLPGAARPRAPSPEGGQCGGLGGRARPPRGGGGASGRSVGGRHALIRTSEEEGLAASCRVRLSYRPRKLRPSPERTNGAQ